ncbi:conserved exported protein of unknown function [Thermococcus camini]|uniref:Uncharacterized protein n=2 Tax=Thermococcus camini TaxID=2016373 RepID=A0A7G2D4N6_9EURY|nr:conserved exported protein of unknown function [Thermococcus camini]
MGEKILCLMLGLLVLGVMFSIVNATSDVQRYSNVSLDRTELDLIQKEQFDPKMREYYRILRLMELNGINTEDFLLMLEKRIRKTHEQITTDEAITLAKQYYQQKTGRRFDYRILKILEIGESLKPMGSTEVDTIYDIYNPPTKIYVQTRTKLKFDILDAQYVGMATYVHIKPQFQSLHGYKAHYDYTWQSYYSPEDEKNWVINDLKKKYGIQEYMIEKVHIKYFINAKARKVYYEGLTVGVSMGTTIAGYVEYNYSWIELWSEANYYPDSKTWSNVGYPNDWEGGVEKIRNNMEVHTSAGYAMVGYTPYPAFSYREFGAGSETHIPLKIYSSIWHQQ